MKRARAHFPCLGDFSGQSRFAAMCPMRALLDVSQRGLLKDNLFKQLNKKKRLTLYLQMISGIDKYIAPYALRIGGRTWLLSKGMDRQLVDFLGTWKIPEASARYYRATPHMVLRTMKDFYSSLNSVA